MKKCLILLISLILMGSALAEPALVQPKVGGHYKSTHYVCVSNLGCLNLSQIKNGRKFPLQSGDVTYIFLADISTLRMYPQKLPASCNTNVGENQTLVISGKVAKAANDDVYIDNLRCSVVNQ